MCKEEPDVMIALARQQDEEDARDRKRARLVEDANAKTLTAVRLRQQIKQASELLKRRQQQVLEAETLLETRHAVKQFSLGDLGHGRSRGGGAASKKRRLEVLDRLAHIGQGLSAAQKNDFSWWKDAWDEKMLQEHAENWPKVFAEWVQKVLDDCSADITNAFSIFVHDETRRCFHDDFALRVP